MPHNLSQCFKLANGLPLLFNCVHVPEEDDLGVPAGVASLAVHTTTHDPPQGVPFLQ